MSGGRRTAEDAARTRAAIVRAAADIASERGLEGLSIGVLAEALEMSKSGVIGHFGSKEELQLAALDHAFTVFREAVWAPAADLPAGLPRLLAVCAAWTEYAAHPGFRGGCCIAQFVFEMDARPGRVRDELARGLRRWRLALISDIAHAVGAGDLPADTEPEQLASALEAIAEGINPARMLHENPDAPSWALQAMHAVLGVDPTAARPVTVTG
jgi:AcrR family transcriptional regulator